MTCYIYYNNVSNELEYRNEHSVKYQRSPTKWGANIPPGVGVRFIVPVSLHYQKRIFTSSNTCFHIIKYVYSFHHTHISVCHFVGVSVYAGAINRPLRLRTVCQNIADGLR